MPTVSEKMKDVTRFLDKYDGEDSNTLRWLLRELSDALERKDCDRDVNCLPRIMLGTSFIQRLSGRLMFVMEPKRTNRRNASMVANKDKKIWTLR